MTVEAAPPTLGYAALFLRFLRLGAFAFGGPVAQIAMIRREFVDEGRWIDGARFNRLLAVMQVLPGPEAHELCVHLGIRARGRLGGLLAGLGFMLPGLALMLLCAWAYASLPLQGTLWGAAFLGAQATVLAVIFRAVHRIAEHVLSEGRLWLLAGAAALATIQSASFWVFLPIAGAAYAAGAARRVWFYAALLGLLVLPLVLPAAGPAPPLKAGPAEAAALLPLFLTGLKAGLLTFGGAYTAIPFVRADTVGRGWATDAQFLDGVGLANVLPAPLVVFATFVGWMSGGPFGALAVTVGVFLPAFAFSMLFYERLEAAVDNPRLQALLIGVAAAVVGVIAVTALDLARDAAGRTPDLRLTAGLFMGSLAVVYLWKSKLAAPVVLAAGAASGALLFS